MNASNVPMAVRDSGIAGLREIPAHWRVMALKHLVGMPITDGPHETPDFVDSGVPFVSAEAVWSGRVHIDDMRGFISRDAHDLYSKKYRPAKNDIFIVKSGATTGKVAIVDIEDEFGVWSPLAAIRCDQEQALPQFIFYSLVSDYFQEQVQTSWSLGTQPNIGMEVLENLYVFLPPLPVQCAIADYLDQETSRLDALVAAKERVLGLLTEKRRAIITHAVTRGINPRAALRDSGIPWLGEIPAHWEIKKLKYVAFLKSGDFITSETIAPSGDYPVFGGNGIRGFSSSFTHEGDYVLIGRQGALCGNVNYASGRFWASEHAVVAHILGSDQFKWLGELLQILNLNQFSQSAAQPGLAVEVIANLSIPVPPIEDQLAIVAHIASETAKLDALREATERTVTLLKERRAALIAAAVTGMIDVEVAA